MARLETLVRQQRRWIAEHGGSRAGYIMRYGSAREAVHYGDGGEAIWKADSDELARLEAELASVRRPIPPKKGL